MTESEIGQLGVNGWFSREDCECAEPSEAAAQELVATHQLHAGRISKDHTVQPTVRGDTTCWPDARSPKFAALWGMFEALRCELNRDVWLGLARFDAQLAHYPGAGERYARHRDAFAGPESRRLTAIVYLNPQWRASHGGELRIHSTPTVDIAPMMGRLVVFRSALIEHEVLGSFAPRLAATAWFYG